jgi:hypothetical protein
LQLGQRSSFCQKLLGGWQLGSWGVWGAGEARIVTHTLVGVTIWCVEQPDVGRGEREVGLLETGAMVDDGRVLKQGDDNDAGLQDLSEQISEPLTQEVK